MTDETPNPAVDPATDRAGNRPGNGARNRAGDRVGDPVGGRDVGPRLRADCARCAGLCCVVPAFSASADFAIDKPAGHPCPNLRTDFACGIHENLRERGFPGCAVYDCFGAGQHVVQITFEGRDWRGAPEIAAGMFEAFAVMRRLHEMLWYLTAALSVRVVPVPESLRTRLRSTYETIEPLTNADAESLSKLDLDPQWRAVDALLVETSELVRSATGRPGPDRKGADLIGKPLRGKDFRHANLRGAYLIGADLEAADLRWADLIGADLRAANVAAADLSESLFLTQAQVDSANGDAVTKLPSKLRRPTHWS